ncbi:MAG: polyketide cyclase / dehydrase and lipid transport [Actinomycetales bacterium]
MHGEDLSDDTYVAAAPRDVAAVTGDPARWRGWWPDLTLTVTRDRGAEGVEWDVTGGLRGTAEIWLEPVADGTVVHFYLRAAMGGRERRRRALAWKRSVYAVKDALEPGRTAGTPVRRSSP